MKILMITENDPAGMGIAFSNAINRYTEHLCRLVTTKIKYNFNFEKDIHVPDLGMAQKNNSCQLNTKKRFEEIEHLLKETDIIHFHMLADENLKLGPIKIKDFIKGKAILHHHHGHPEFRLNPKKYKQKYRELNRKVLVSTPDLLRLLPEATWQPNLVPINDSLYMCSVSNNNGIVKIGQSATRKNLKNTDELVSSIHKLQQTHNNITFEIIENTDCRECLRKKQQCDIIFDHMQGYYGVSSLESLSQGKPVIAGLDEWNTMHIKKFTGTADLPWLIARSKDELYIQLQTLIVNEELKYKTGIQSRKFMENNWSEESVLKVLFNAYDNL